MNIPGMRKLGYIFLLLNIFAQANSQPSKRELIRDLIPVREICDSIIQQKIRNGMPITIDINNSGNIPAGYSPGLLKKTEDELIEKIITIYDSLFTTEEILNLVTFFSTDEGKKIRTALPELISMTIRAEQEWFDATLRSAEDPVKPLQDVLTQQDFAYVDTELSPDNPYRYRKNRKSRTFFSRTDGKYRIYYNKKIWEETDPRKINAAADAAFKMKGREVYGIVIYENNDLNIKELRYTAVYNIHKAFRRYVIQRDALREINGSELLLMQVSALVNSVDIMYINYYYTADSDVIQFSVFCDASMFSSEKQKMEDLLNGLVIKKTQGIFQKRK